MNRNRIFIFLLAFTVIFASAVAGCGGGTPETKPAVDQSQNQDQQVQTTGTTTPLAEPITLPKKFEVGKTTPEFFKEALERKRPIIVFFYSENDTASDSVRENIKLVADKPQYSDVIILALNINKPEHVFGLIEPLGVTYAPFIAVIDDTGTIVKEFSGYVDEKSLEQAIYDVVRNQTTVTTETDSN